MGITLTKQRKALSQSSNSSRARAILDDWGNACARFVKVLPKDYKRALIEMRNEAAAKAAAE